MIRELKPEWLKVRAPSGERYALVKQTLRDTDLHTVCEEARCPNVGECWDSGTATFMLLGDVCTRGCRFCAVTKGNPRTVVDLREPDNTAIAAERMGLDYVVLTMVDRDDLVDGGAGHVARTIRAIRGRCPGIRVEALVSDFRGVAADVRTVLDAEPDVFGHNVETVRRLVPEVRDARSSYDQSLAVLAIARSIPGEHLTKSSIMLGLGETLEEVLETMRDLRDVGVEVLTLGQYLRPSEKHHAVARWVTPAEFDELRVAGERMGFGIVASGPLVRSSYRAAEHFVRRRLAVVRAGLQES
ncbi:MAG: lipoyl synthase [Deltaproteobacteria bacterium]|nr:lipoyl synthase [Deltaproteobacteria bacterium]